MMGLKRVSTTGMQAREPTVDVFALLNPRRGVKRGVSKGIKGNAF
jgi:hypothetical protein